VVLVLEPWLGKPCKVILVYFYIVARRNSSASKSDKSDTVWTVKMTVVCNFKSLKSIRILLVWIYGIQARNQAVYW
jgi:hypothetical protein